MCLTCGCEKAHLQMGDNITFEDVQRMADSNGKSVDETLQTIQRTADIDRREHAQEYAESGRVNS